MSKITNDGLTRSLWQDALYHGNSRRQTVNSIYESVYEIFLSCSSDSSITYTIGLEDSRTYMHGQLVLGLALKIKYTSPRVWSGLLENTFYSCMTWARTWIRHIATICQWWKHS